MTMANSTLSTQPRPSASLRKTNKPLMEKRRRARINDSLTQLKGLVIQGSKKDSSQFNKLEKADILELTVKHLRNLQTQQQQQQQQHLSHSAANDVTLTGKYQAGFMECANEVIRYLSQSQNFSDDIKARVIGHLASCIQLSSKHRYMKQGQPGNMAAGTSSILAPASKVSSGQILGGPVIQIVNSPYHSVKSSPLHQPSTAAVPIAPAPPALSSSSTSAPHVAATSRLVSTSTAATAQVPAHVPYSTSTQPSQHIRYSQPLHIHIPTVLSPRLLQPQSTQPTPPSQPTYSPSPSVPNGQPLSSRLSGHLSQTSPVESSMLSAHESPLARDSSYSPAPHMAIKEHYPCPSHMDHSSELLPRARTHSMTSSSSNDSDLVSPLNLSHSPSYDDAHMDGYSRKLTDLDTGRHTGFHTFHSDRLSANPQTCMSDFRLSHSHSGSYRSVIVDARKSGEIHGYKYNIQFTGDDERPCPSHEGSSSPASSMGEERLWRPW